MCSTVGFAVLELPPHVPLLSLDLAQVPTASCTIDLTRETTVAGRRETTVAGTRETTVAGTSRKRKGSGQFLVAIKEWLHTHSIIPTIRSLLRAHFNHNASIIPLSSESLIRVKVGCDASAQTRTHVDYFYYATQSAVHAKVIGPTAFTIFPVECRQNVCQICFIDGPETLVCCNWCQSAFHSDCLTVRPDDGKPFHCAECLKVCQPTLVTCWLPLHATPHASELWISPCSHLCKFSGLKEVPAEFRESEAAWLSSKQLLTSPRAFLCFQSRTVHRAAPPPADGTAAAEDQLRISLDVRFAIRPAPHTFWDSYLAVQAETEILYCVERMHQVLLLETTCKIFEAEAENLVFLTSVLFSLLDPTTKCARYIRAAVTQMVGTLARYPTLFHSPVLHLALHKAGLPPPPSSPQTASAEIMIGENSEEWTRAMTLEWISAQGRDGLQKWVPILNGILSGAAEPSTDDMYFVTHFVLCATNWGAARLEAAEEIGRFLCDRASQSKHGFECWLEAQICAKLVHCPFDESVRPTVMKHVDPLFVSRRLRVPVARLRSPYLKLVSKDAYTTRYAKHIDYHTHFLVALYWVLTTRRTD